MWQALNRHFIFKTSLLGGLLYSFFIDEEIDEREYVTCFMSQGY